MKQQNNEHYDVNDEQPEKHVRKSLQDEIKNNGQSKFSYYLFYIARQSTSFFMIWVSLVLMYGVICMYTNDAGQDEFYRFIFFLQKPIVIVINTLALLSALLHTITWFNTVPKAVNTVRGDKQNSPTFLIIGLWVLTIAVSTMLLLIVLK